MVMRAAIGDFEETLIFGAMQQSPSSGHSIRDKRNFFLPDIRSFALIALEIISNMCEKKFCTYQYEWDQYCCLTPTQQFFSYIMARTSYFSMK
jgi:acyl carrier protein phosphodiesterase